MTRQKSSLTSPHSKGWTASVAEDGQYLYLDRIGKPGQVHVKADDDGFVVDLWNHDEQEVVTGVSATYAELEFDEDDDAPAAGCEAETDGGNAGIDMRGATSIALGGWTITTGRNGDWVSIDRPGKPGQIHVKDRDDWLEAALWNHDEQIFVGMASASYDELGISSEE